uniref:Uncharacterized protein n=1 Tax=Anguilla anguilla TaxID=7936 RepID=A0A0E9SMF7_ANGAN
MTASANHLFEQTASANYCFKQQTASTN